MKSEVSVGAGKAAESVVGDAGNECVFFVGELYLCCVRGVLCVGTWLMYL